MQNCLRTIGTSRAVSGFVVLRGVCVGGEIVSRLTRFLDHRQRLSRNVFSVSSEAVCIGRERRGDPFLVFPSASAVGLSALRFVSIGFPTFLGSMIGEPHPELPHDPCRQTSAQTSTAETVFLALYCSMAQLRSGSS